MGSALIGLHSKWRGTIGRLRVFSYDGQAQAGVNIKVGPRRDRTLIPPPSFLRISFLSQSVQPVPHSFASRRYNSTRWRPLLPNQLRTPTAALAAASARPLAIPPPRTRKSWRPTTPPRWRSPIRLSLRLTPRPPNLRRLAMSRTATSSTRSSRCPSESALRLNWREGWRGTAMMRMRGGGDSQ